MGEVGAEGGRDGGREEGLHLFLGCFVSAVALYRIGAAVRREGGREGGRVNMPLDSPTHRHPPIH